MQNSDCQDVGQIWESNLGFPISAFGLSYVGLICCTSTIDRSIAAEPINCYFTKFMLFLLQSVMAVEINVNLETMDIESSKTDVTNR